MASANGEETLELEESQSRDRRRTMPVLHWVFPDAVAGRVVPLPHGATLGRAETCSVRLDGEGVSRQHAEILREGPALALRDTGSTNGTFLNGRRVQHATVADGAVLRIGAWVGLFGWTLVDERDESGGGGDSGGGDGGDRGNSGARGESGDSSASGFSLIAPGLWGGRRLQEALEPGRRAAASNLPLLLVGDTGTGKELCARALHGWSGRRGRFIAVSSHCRCRATVDWRIRCWMPAIATQMTSTARSAKPSPESPPRAPHKIGPRLIRACASSTCCEGTARTRS